MNVAMNAFSKNKLLINSNLNRELKCLQKKYGLVRKKNK